MNRVDQWTNHHIQHMHTGFIATQYLLSSEWFEALYRCLSTFAKNILATGTIEMECHEL